jgi:hypothetical protein
MEYFNGIEHERNFNQGKTHKQNKDSAKIFIVGVLILMAIVIGLVIANKLR